MKNIIFGNYDAFLDWGLIRTGTTIGAPTPKMRTLDIEGTDGEYDETEYFGDVNYSTRTLSFDFETIKRNEEFNELYSQILNAIHGRRLVVKPSEEIDFYYIGRINVNSWKSDKSIGRITIDVIADPYKLKNNPTVISSTMNGTTRVSCYNLRRKVIPTITISGEATIVYRTYTATGELLKEYRYKPNVSSYPYTFTRPEFLFKEGNNVLEVTMNGVITIEYQEGAL